jgi:cytochrome c oxidase cbb3-type subunit III
MNSLRSATPRKIRSAVASAALLALFSGGVMSGCKRETRDFQAPPPSPPPVTQLRLSELRPGQSVPPPHAHNDAEDNAMALNEGKQLFSSFNCVGCHGNGGGNMGPPLIDQTWIYGSEPEQIYATIAQGRPNGMPAFGDKLNSKQIWELTAYVRSLAGLVPKDAASGRSDQMKSNPPPNSIDPSTPAAPNIPRSAEAPN